MNLSRDLGMRHRAGIGMSEHSDAVVVIVSEETGSISAVVGGMLKRHLAPETLERLEAAGAAVYRTDEDGSVTVRVREDRVGIYTTKGGGLHAAEKG